MIMNLVFLLACLSFLCAIVSYGCGCVAIIKGKAQPSIISRFFWVILSITNFFSYLSLGAGSGMSLALSGFLGSVTVFILSLKYGYIEFKKADVLTVIGACVALLCYFFVPIKSISLIAGLLTHFIGGIPTYRKTWQNPYVENLPFWALFALASACSLLSVVIENKNMIFPMYFFFFDAGMALLIVIKRRQIKLKSTSSSIEFDLESI